MEDVITFSLPPSRVFYYIRMEILHVRVGRHFKPTAKDQRPSYVEVREDQPYNLVKYYESFRSAFACPRRANLGLFVAVHTP